MSKNLWRKIGHQSKDGTLNQSKDRSLETIDKNYEDLKLSFGPTSQNSHFIRKQSLVQARNQIIKCLYSIQDEQKQQLFQSILGHFPSRTPTFGQNQMESEDSYKQINEKYGTMVCEAFRPITGDIKNLKQLFLIVKIDCQKQIDKMSKLLYENMKELNQTLTNVLNKKGEMAFLVKKLTLQNEILKKINIEKEKRILESENKLKNSQFEIKELKEKLKQLKKQFPQDSLQLTREQKNQLANQNEQQQNFKNSSLHERKSKSRFFQISKLQAKSFSHLDEGKKKVHFLQVPDNYNLCTSITDRNTDNLLQVPASKSNTSSQSSSSLKNQKHPSSTRQIKWKDNDPNQPDSPLINVIPSHQVATSRLKYSPSQKRIKSKEKSNCPSSQSNNFKQRMMLMDQSLRNSIKRVKENIGASLRENKSFAT